MRFSTSVSPRSQLSPGVNPTDSNHVQNGLSLSTSGAYTLAAASVSLVKLGGNTVSRDPGIAQQLPRNVTEACVVVSGSQLTTGPFLDSV